MRAPSGGAIMGITVPHGNLSRRLLAAARAVTPLQLKRFSLGGHPTRTRYRGRPGFSLAEELAATRGPLENQGPLEHLHIKHGRLLARTRQLQRERSRRSTRALEPSRRATAESVTTTS